VPVRGVAEEVVPDYGQDDDSEEAPVVTKKVAKKKFYDPEILLLDPKPRTFSNVSLVNAQPCGGAEKSLVHYVTTPGSRNFVQWKVTHAAADANCTVRLGHGLDQEEGDEGRFIVLRPRDGSAGPDGSFPCGREVGYEGKEFSFPKTFTCDSCTLQFEWALPGGG